MNSTTRTGPVRSDADADANTIAVVLNGESLRIGRSATLADLLDQHLPATTKVASAVNGEFVARGARARRTLSEGDVVLTFAPVVGG